MAVQDVVIARTQADEEAARAVENHHAQMAGKLTALVSDLVEAAVARDAGRAETARTSLVSWAETELVPHAVAEEKAMYPVAHAMTEGRLLVDGMLAEHQAITGLVSAVKQTTDPVRAAAAATALSHMFESHLAKENELILPLLLGDPEVSVADLLGGMHDLLGAHAGPGGEHAHGHEHGAAEEHAGHTCGCHEAEVQGHPVLDAREIPHAIRHATIFGALDTVRPGQGLVLIAPHDPLPLLGQVEQRYAGAFEVSYLERGPQDWRLQLLRVG